MLKSQLYRAVLWVIVLILGSESAIAPAGSPCDPALRGISGPRGCKQRHNPDRCDGIYRKRRHRGPFIRQEAVRPWHRDSGAN